MSVIRLMLAILMAIPEFGLGAPTTLGVEVSGRGGARELFTVTADDNQVAIVTTGVNVAAAIPDEQSLARPLAVMPNARQIVAAFWKVFHECGLGASEASATNEDNTWMSLVQSTNYVPVGDKIGLLVGQFQGPGALIRLDTLTIVSPQCPVGVDGLYWSARGKRVLVVARRVQKVSFPTNRKSVWSADLASDRTLYYLNTDTATNFQKLTSVGSEIVIDAYLPQGSTDIWVLTKVEHGKYLNPLNWISILAGHPPYEAEIIVRRISPEGRTLARAVVRERVPNGTGRFVRRGVNDNGPGSD